MTEIQQFYNGQSIFITGGTGYLGKVLIEKLLRSCPGIKAIYILVRPKKGKTMSQRLQKIINLPLFEPLKKIDPNFGVKIVPLAGDLMDSDLGLSPADRELIMKEVSIVFHAAATTRFDEPLKTAIKINVDSVETIIDICKGCTNFKALVYVSTAFSNCIYDHIEEKVYPAPLSLQELRNVVKVLDSMNFSEEEEEKFTNMIIGKFPNTYCFTKAIAEEFVRNHTNDLPVCIYRFSIALASLKEPVPGWLDTAQAITQTILRSGRGIIRVLNITGETKMETVPIDLACNCLISSVWETGIREKSTNEELRVYNYVSSRDNPVTWNFLKDYLIQQRFKLALEKTLYYPDLVYVQSVKLFFILHYILHFIPAIIGDIVLKIMGQKPKFYKVFERGTKLVTVIRFFTNGEWLFETENVKSLWNKLSDEDKKLFNFDITSFTWEEMLETHCKGGKKYFLREDMSPAAQEKACQKMRRLYYIHQIVRTIFYASVLWIFWKIYCLLF